MSVKPLARFVQTDEGNKLRRALSQPDSRLARFVTRLSQVLASSDQKVRPFAYMPQAFRANRDELLWEKKYAILDQMRRHPIIKDAMRAKRSTLIKDWRVVPSDERAEIAVETARFTSDCCLMMLGSFMWGLRRLTTALEYGFSLLEQPFKLIQYGPWAGMLAFDWAPRLQHFLDFEKDKDTGRLKVLQYKSGGGTPRQAWADECIHYVYQGDLDPWRGDGDLRACYSDWWMADTTQKFLGIHLEAMGTGKIKVGVDEGVTVMDETMIEEAVKLIDNWQNLFAFIQFPGLSVENLEAGEPSGQHYLAVIEHCEERMRMAIGKPGLLSESEQNGGLAGGQTGLGGEQKGQFYAELGEPKDDIEELVKQRCFKPLLQANGIPLEYLPSLSLAPPAQEDGKAKADGFIAGVDAGIVKLRDGDEDDYRQWVGARATEDLGPPIAAAGAAPEEPGQMGPAALSLARKLYGASLPPHRKKTRGTLAVVRQWPRDAEVFEAEIADVEFAAPGSGGQFAPGGGRVAGTGPKPKTTRVAREKIKAKTKKTIEKVAKIKQAAAAKQAEADGMRKQVEDLDQLDEEGRRERYLKEDEKQARADMLSKQAELEERNSQLMDRDSELDAKNESEGLTDDEVSERTKIAKDSIAIDRQIEGIDGKLERLDEKVSERNSREMDRLDEKAQDIEDQASEIRGKTEDEIDDLRGWITEDATESDDPGLGGHSPAVLVADELDTALAERQRQIKLNDIEALPRDDQRLYGVLHRQAAAAERMGDTEGLAQANAGLQRLNDKALEAVEKETASIERVRERLQKKGRVEPQILDNKHVRKALPDLDWESINDQADADEQVSPESPFRSRIGGRRTFAAADPVFAQLDALAREHTQQISFEFAKALWNLWGKIETEFLTDKLTPGEKLQALRSVGDMLNLDAIARSLIAASEAAVELGRSVAGKVLPKTFERQSVNPAGVDTLRAWSGLMKAKSYRTADDLKATVVGKIRKLLERSFGTGEPNKATQERLRGEFTEMAGANLIEPGPQRTMNFKSPLVQETTVRTAMADASDHGKLDAWSSAADAGFVVGFERVEDIDPDRNHPLSPKVNGLKIPWNHPLAQEFVGALHYSERGGIKPITARKAEAPGFAFSTDAEIRRAYDAKRRLSKDFV